MRAVNLKLLRECWRLKGQLFSIALVVATGIMTVITMRGSYESLVSAQQSYYDQARFADVWISLRRAPEAVRDRIADIPGVAMVDTRVTLLATMDLPDVDEPAMARLISVPETARPLLNDILIRRGRYVQPGASDEIIVNEKFAVARQLQPGDSVRVIINGRARDLEIVGIGMSPEHSYAVPPGTLLPDDERYAVIWMGRRALGPAYDMDGAFNEAVLRLNPDAREAEVITRLNELLEPWGGYGAYPRADQPSHMMLESELDENRVMGTVIPLIFLAVAVFLLHLVLGRMITTQRGEIAVLKSFGYSNFEVGTHYLMFAAVAAGVGTVVGTIGGVLLGGGMIDLYALYFDLPDLEYRLSFPLLLLAVSVTVAGACTGAMGAIRKAVTLPPAEAMRPEPPATFKPGWMERMGVGNLLSSSGRMILRNVERKPVQGMLSSVGVAMSVAILIVGLFLLDGVNQMIDLQFRQIQREDVSVNFMENRPDAVRHELRRLPGVTHVETWRVVPARLTAGHRSLDSVIQGIPADSMLRRIINDRGHEHPLPADGVVLSRFLADRLSVRTGDSLELHFLEGQRRVTQTRISGIVEDLLGTAVYMDLSALERVSGESGIVSGAWLAVDERERDSLYRELKNMPLVGGVTSPTSMLESFESEMAEVIYIVIGFLSGFAAIISVGVIYNGARIALSERGRELASLRVMGFHRNEVTVLLLGEQAIITLVAIPLGCLIGYGLAWAVVQAMQTEMFRIPYVVSPRTWMLATAITLAAAFASGLAVRRRLHRYDLISVLKTRE